MSVFVVVVSIVAAIAPSVSVQHDVDDDGHGRSRGNENEDSSDHHRIDVRTGGRAKGVAGALLRKDRVVVSAAALLRTAKQPRCMPRYDRDDALSSLFIIIIPDSHPVKATHHTIS